MSDAVFWSVATGLAHFVEKPSGGTATIVAASHDGAVLVGYGNIVAGNGRTDTGPLRASYWNAGGTATVLQVPDGYSDTLANGISRDGTVVWGTADPLPAFPPSNQWTITSKFTAPVEGGIGDLRMDQSYIDFSDLTTRRNFINADKSWVYLGYYGDTPTDTYPLVWNTVQTGNAPDDFIVGYGQHAGANGWNVVAVGNDPITGLPYPAMSFDLCLPSAELSMDYLDVTSVSDSATELHKVTLRWSDTRGASWADPVIQSMGEQGQYDVDIQFRRLGMSRDRVWEISWSTNAATALTGVFLEYEVAAS